MAYYGDALREIVTLINTRCRVRVYDLDILKDDLPVRADVVLLIAVLEHLNGTPRYPLEKANRILDPAGFLIVDVPNAATLTKRLAFLLRGTPPYLPFQDYYLSEYPFSGRNREHTVKDLSCALQQTELVIVEQDVFHHGTGESMPCHLRLLRAVEELGPAAWRLCIWAVARIGSSATLASHSMHWSQLAGRGES